MTKKVVLMLLLAYPALTWAQDTIGQKQWKEGVYKELPFSFPETLSNAEVKGILLSIQSLTIHEVRIILLQSKDKVTVETCSHGIREPFMCDGGGFFVFQKSKNGWVEMPDQRGVWVQ